MDTSALADFLAILGQYFKVGPIAEATTRGIIYGSFFAAIVIAWGYVFSGSTSAWAYNRKAVKLDRQSAILERTYAEADGLIAVLKERLADAIRPLSPTAMPLSPTVSPSSPNPIGAAPGVPVSSMMALPPLPSRPPSL